MGLEPTSLTPRQPFSLLKLKELWWTLPGSNRWPQACKASALPSELRAHIIATYLCSDGVANHPVFLWPYTKSWWGIRDSNPYALRHWSLNPARLPIPPIPHIEPDLGLDGSLTSWTIKRSSTTLLWLIFTRNYIAKTSLSAFITIDSDRWRERRDLNPRPTD